MINIILCGGSGTRLWPLSRTMLPKQFVRLFEGRSLFQDTVLRNQPVCKECLIVSNNEQYFLAADQLQQVSAMNSQFLLEPSRRVIPLRRLLWRVCNWIRMIWYW
jgi:mannose-1-phosphate guanylyltransferase